jgi:hypothetical protein
MVLADTQPLDNRILDIDHLMCGVADARAAAVDFARLGFTVTPPSAIEAMGLSNVLICMRPQRSGVANFLELMAVERPETVPPPMQQLLAGEPGIKSMVLAVDDVAGHRAALVEAGYAMHDVWPVQREWTLPSGETLEFRFRVVLPEHGQAPVTFNAVEYATLQHYLRPEFQEHPNGAERLAEVLVAAPAAQLEQVARRYATLFGTSWRAEARGVVVEARDVALRLVAAERLGELLPGGGQLGAVTRPRAIGVAITGASRERAAAVLERGGVPFSPGDDGALRVAAEHACGNVLELREAA